MCILAVYALSRSGHGSVNHQNRIEPNQIAQMVRNN